MNQESTIFIKFCEDGTFFKNNEIFGLCTFFLRLYTGSWTYIIKGRNYEFKAEGAKYHLEPRSKSQALVRFSFKTMGAIYPLERI